MEVSSWENSSINMGHIFNSFLLNYQRVYNYNIHPIPCSYGHSDKNTTIHRSQRCGVIPDKKQWILGVFNARGKGLILFLSYEGILKSEYLELHLGL